MIVSCSSPIENIPLENYFEHRTYLLDRNDKKEEDFKIYESLLNDNPNLGNSPHIYYYLSRLENDKKYLKIGLNLFPNDPYINFNRKKYITSVEDKRNLFKEILNENPKHNLSLQNLLSSYEISSDQNLSSDYLIENSNIINELNDYIKKYEGPLQVKSNKDLVEKKESNKKNRFYREIKFPKYLVDKKINPYSCNNWDTEGDIGFTYNNGNYQVYGDHWGGRIVQTLLSFDSESTLPSFYFVHEWGNETGESGIDSLQLSFYDNGEVFKHNTNNKIKYFLCNGENIIKNFTVDYEGGIIY